MSNYRRAFQLGGIYFFTVVTHDRRPLFSDAHAIERLRNAFRYVKQRRPFDIDAMVILPDHLHCLWFLPTDDADYATRWQMIKTHFTRAMNRAGEQGPYWQPRYWEHLIRDESDLTRHRDYIHYNPVKHGLVARPGDWTASSFARFVRDGLYPTNWAAGPSDDTNYGE
ncbi:MAG: transposase [Gammaproteobacteria bacterium]|nr:transposase [Gammaproteobacteria bacterium]MCP5136797.1 transposase [Gammaproteobacteria bacterium]